MSQESPDVGQVARAAFGWAELRPGQREAMEALVAGRDVLLVLPTGAGKSAVYQVPALIRPGPTVVVSPLLALQQDQLEAVSRTGEGAVRISSTVSRGDRDAALRALRHGAVEFAFVTPEQLADPDVVAALKDAAPSLVAVDEAHCVSTWGHDFRPDYLQLGKAVRALGHPPVVALTATAAPPVRDDVVRRLGLRDPLVLVHGLDRPNLELEVATFVEERDREAAVVQHVLSEPSPGIVYTATRRSAEHLAAVLAENGLRAAGYHGGMGSTRREEVQTSFMDGALDVVVATGAFGMGVDKADARYVLHATTPDSPDTYVQESGRAGRDGEPAHAVLLHRTQDLSLRRFLSGGLPDPERLAALARLVARADRPLGRAALREATGLGPTSLGRALNLLEEAGAVRRDARGRVVPARDAPAPETAGRAALREAERHRQVERSRLEMMRGYVETLGCRRQYLLGYLGEVLVAPCGRCDTCRSGSAAQQAYEAGGTALFSVHARVRHPDWGEGTVMTQDSGTVVVLFGSVGYKTLAADVVADRDLLAPA